MNIFSEEINTIEDKNIYGGKTLERIFNVNEQAQLNYSKLIQYFNSKNEIVKVSATPSKAFIEQTGMIEQIDYYRNGVIEKHEKHFTEQFRTNHCFNKLIEEINVRGEIIKRIWYYNDTILDTLESADNRFTFYDIHFIENEFFEDYQPSANDVINISARYYSTKSVIKFGNELIELNDDDIKLMDYFSDAFGLNKFSHFYSKKVKVYSGNKSYWFYVQTQLEKSITGQNATIRYYPIGKNKELFLIGIGFYNIR
jgi:hypothetical protein